MWPVRAKFTRTVLFLSMSANSPWQSSQAYECSSLDRPDFADLFFPNRPEDRLEDGVWMLLDSGSNPLSLLIVNWHDRADRRPVVDKAFEFGFLKSGWVDGNAGSPGLEGPRR